MRYNITLAGPFANDKDLILMATLQDSIRFISTGSDVSMLINSKTTVTLDEFHIMNLEGVSSTFENNGALTLKNARLYQNANSL